MLWLRHSTAFNMNMNSNDRIIASSLDNNIG